MFLYVSVILSTGGWYPSMHCRWYPSMPCSRSPRGVVSQHALQVSRPTPRGGGVEGSGQGGALGPHPGGVSPGPHPVGCQAHTQGMCVSQHALRQPPPPPTAIAAGGTHPTGMYSCGYCILSLRMLF